VFASPRYFPRTWPRRSPHAEGIEFTGRHWQVTKLMRHQYEAKGTRPIVRVLGKTVVGGEIIFT
jgi:sulfur relay (sulfurtransferase) DsrC/TusE family protein